MAEHSLDALRTRYYDWCSGRIIERFLDLSPEEVWHRAAQVGDGSEVASVARGQEALPPISLSLVRVLSQQLADELALPSFEAWVEQYRRDPDRYEREIGARREPDAQPAETSPS